MRMCKLTLAMVLTPALLLAAAVMPVEPARAQEADAPAAEAVEPEGGPSAEPETAEARAARLLAEGEQQEADTATDADAAAAEDVLVQEQINLLSLILAGGYLMIPIGLMSFLVVTFGVERGLALRRHKVLPPELISSLGTLASQKGGLDPRKAYKLCQQHPSAAASVIKAMLLKVGRPHTELEQAVADASGREAARLNTNVRWLALSAGVTPLMGLLGTVWGMIQAFFVTAHLPTGANKAEHLADGIYVALVTTFAGLAVAIPAAVLAHLFEGRIQQLLLELDETLLGLMPQLERFEGKLRVSREIEIADRARRGQSEEESQDRKNKEEAQPAAATPK